MDTQLLKAYLHFFGQLNRIMHLDSTNTYCITENMTTSRWIYVNSWIAGDFNKPDGECSYYFHFLYIFAAFAAEQNNFLFVRTIHIPNENLLWRHVTWDATAERYFRKRMLSGQRQSASQEELWACLHYLLQEYDDYDDNFWLKKFFEKNCRFQYFCID